jgi:hypothetical protein
VEEAAVEVVAAIRIAPTTPATHQSKGVPRSDVGSARRKDIKLQGPGTGTAMMKKNNKITSRPALLQPTMVLTPIGMLTVELHIMSQEKWKSSLFETSTMKEIKCIQEMAQV